MKSFFSISKNPVASLGRVTHSIAECFRRLGEPLKFVDTINADIALDCPTYRGKSNYLITFWETSKLRPADVAWFKSRRGLKVIVTCDHTQKVFAAEGLKTRKIPLAAEHNPTILTPLKPFVFYSIYQDAGFWERKRAQDTVDAFERAFKGVSDVRLVIKQGKTCTPLVTFDRRIEIIRDYIDDVTHIHQQGHVFVSTSGAEGWGYPHHDAIAHGRPVICQRIGGPLEFLDASCAWFVTPVMHKAPFAFYENCGEIGHVSIKELAATMRHVYNNPVEVMEKSTAAFIRARSFTLDQMTVAVKKAFDL
jgi:glycosyltransferase involved in cell wall biosynthesis